METDIEKLAGEYLAYKKNTPLKERISPFETVSVFSSSMMFNLFFLGRVIGENMTFTEAHDLKMKIVDRSAEMEINK